jgi:hypothetical protein
MAKTYFSMIFTTRKEVLESMKKFPRDCLYEVPKCKYFESNLPGSDDTSYICRCEVLKENYDVRHPNKYEQQICPLTKPCHL